MHKSIFQLERDPSLSPDEFRADRLDRHGPIERFTASHDHVVVEEHVAAALGAAAP